MPAPTLISIRRTAERIANGRPVTTGHVLAAVATRPGAGAELLREWRLTPEVLCQAARILSDNDDGAVDRAMQRARELASRSSRVPSGVRLLAGLFEERASAAYRAIDQCGAEKLRTVVMQIAALPGRAMGMPMVSRGPARA